MPPQVRGTFMLYGVRALRDDGGVLGKFWRRLLVGYTEGREYVRRGERQSILLSSRARHGRHIVGTNRGGGLGRAVSDCTGRRVRGGRRAEARRAGSTGRPLWAEEEGRGGAAVHASARGAVRGRVARHRCARRHGAVLGDGRHVLAHRRSGACVARAGAWMHMGEVGKRRSTIW